MRTPTPATHSPDARRALLRRTWQPPFDALQVDYSRPDLHIELTASDRSLLSGVWPFETTIDGRPLSAAGPWEEVCWHSDQEVDYLELERPLSGSWKLQRQMALARKDQFLYLADAVMGGEALPESAKAEIRHTFQLPLAAGLTLDLAAETRDVKLVQGRKRVARMLPTALPEWRAELCPGCLACESGNLKLHHAGEGRNLYSPLWLDLSPNRLRRDCTWRRLTVGQDLEVQPRDVAAAYRIQCGKEQWLVYRTLAPKASRTVLGQNYALDFVLCRFLPTGKTEDILELE